MKKIFKFMTLATAAVAAIVFTGCSSDDEFLTSNGGEKAPQTRAAKQNIVIDFENMTTSMGENAMANPTSYGLNYYHNSGYTQVTDLMSSDYVFMSMVNSGRWPDDSDETQSFMFGGIALSDWAMISNPSTNPNPGELFNSEWWYSQFNQMSVYNTERTATGNRGGAGAGGSDNFGIVYGFDDSYGYTKEASFNILMDAATLKSLKICNTAYTYGVIQHGNTWYGENDVVIKTQPLVGNDGYLTLIIKCFDGNDNLIKRVETPLADYRNGKDFCITTWTEIPINASGVSKVQFGFWGSDVVAGGIRTPAYVAIDDIVLE